MCVCNLSYENNKKQQTQTAGAGVLISYGDHEVYVSEPVRSAGMENLDSRQYF